MYVEVWKGLWQSFYVSTQLARDMHYTQPFYKYHFSRGQDLLKKLKYYIVWTYLANPTRFWYENNPCADETWLEVWSYNSPVVLYINNHVRYV